MLKEAEAMHGLRKIVIVGSPNVGKPLLFNCLTRAYATVSNYPGTTVEISRGKTKIGGVSTLFYILNYCCPN